MFTALLIQSSTMFVSPACCNVRAAIVSMIELLYTVQGQQQSQPLRQYSSNTNLAPAVGDPAGDMANGNIAHASNAGSQVSSPRAHAAAGRNVRPRMEQWAGAGTDFLLSETPQCMDIRISATASSG